MLRFALGFILATSGLAENVNSTNTLITNTLLPSFVLHHNTFIYIEWEIKYKRRR